MNSKRLSVSSFCVAAICGLIVGFVITTAKAAPVVIFEEDFESYSVNAVPSTGWTVETNNQIDPGDFVFKVVDAPQGTAPNNNATKFARIGRGNDGQAVAYADLDPLQTSGEPIEISVDVYVSTNASAIWFYGSPAAGSLPASPRSFDVRLLGSKSNSGDFAGGIQYRSGSTFTVIEDVFNPDQWFNVVILADYDAGTYDVLIEGNVVVQGAAFQHAAAKELGSVRLAGLSDTLVTGGATEWAYFDNLKVTVIPEPASLALLGLGGLLMLRRRHAA